MPGERVPMRKIRDVLRLGWGQGLSQRVIARSLGLSQGVVHAYLRRARSAGLGWPLPDETSDAGLEALLFPPASGAAVEDRPQPDWAWVHRELRRPNVTLSLLWEEYRAGAPDGFGYSWFCDLYRSWAGRLKPTLRQVHPAGERIFVDFAGSTMAVLEGAGGAERRAEIFVAVLGASSYTFACAVWSQALPDWIDGHVRAFAHFGGVARQLVSDNLRAGITRACFHEPAVNRTYAEMAAHYGTAVLPARPYKPRDKAKAEVGVQVVQRWILARLRNQSFFSLAELDGAIQALVLQLNERPMRALGTTRRALFEGLDRPALQPLPEVAYEYAAWKRCRVGLDYHVEVERHFYSVPHALVRQEVEARTTAATVEIFHRGQRVASHPRGTRRHQPSTLAEHMPKSHRRYREWSHERIHREAGAIGQDTAALVEVILRSRPHPEQGFRSCIGILGLVKRHGAERVDAACSRALALGTRSYSSVAAILNNRQERRAVPDEPAMLMHENIRGPGYYH
ncbi:IS21 family transposase (plasmid) [Roseomonas mucosa]|nr:IS21 family transposase [Roseomonas mucosa]